MKRRSVRINPDLETKDLKGAGDNADQLFMFVTMKKINLSTSKLKRKLLLILSIY